MCTPEPDEKHRTALNKNVARSAAGLPPVTDVKRVHLELGDVVVVRLSRRLEPGDLDILREHLGATFDGHQVLVLSDEADIEVVSPAEPTVHVAPSPITREQFEAWARGIQAALTGQRSIRPVDNDLDGICGG